MKVMKFADFQKIIDVHLTPGNIHHVIGYPRLYLSINRHVVPSQPAVARHKVHIGMGIHIGTLKLAAPDMQPPGHIFGIALPQGIEQRISFLLIARPGVGRQRHPGLVQGVIMRFDIHRRFLKKFHFKGAPLVFPGKFLVQQSS